ncbi:MAG: metal transporter, partial [Gammaproteobacteria bacterium]|nr:metal transporter [Gammaproteobacteria bacterium]
TLIGIYVGVIPVYLGLFWYPALVQLGRRWMTFLLALTAGLLVFLGLDTLAEAIEQSAVIPGPFQGIGLIGIGTVGTFFLLDAISR